MHHQRIIVESNKKQLLFYWKTNKDVIGYW